MQAMLLREPASYSNNASPLEIAEVPMPVAGNGELLVRVSVCGVCRTDLDVVEGRVKAPRYPVIPGHQVIGHVARNGSRSYCVSITRATCGWSPRFKSVANVTHTDVEMLAAAVLDVGKG